MIDRFKWFERKFDFDLPVSMFPLIVERLRGTPVRVAAMIATYEGLDVTKRVDDRWSIQENVGHLVDLEPLWYGRVDDFLNQEDVLRSADLTNQKTHQANHNARSIDTIMEEFAAERSKIVKRFEALSDEHVLSTALHPRLITPMRMMDLAFFVAEHDDQHLAEMTRLAAALR